MNDIYLSCFVGKLGLRYITMALARDECMDESSFFFLLYGIDLFFPGDL